MFEKHFVKPIGKEWHHEYGSEMMFRDLIKKNQAIADELGLSKDDIDFITALIIGDKETEDRQIIW